MFWILSLIYISLVICGALEFKVFDQALILWEANYDFSFITPHLPRYLMVYPILVFSTYLDCNKNWLFSILISFMVIWITIISIRISSQLISGNLDPRLKIFLLLFFITTSFFMNGRGLYAFTGLLILLSSMIYWDKRSINIISFILWMMLGLLMSSVSSGTMTATMTILFGWLIYRPFKKVGYIKIRELLLCAMCMISALAMGFFYFLNLFIEKNFAFFGGGLNGFINLLQHGILSLSYGFDNNLPIVCLILGVWGCATIFYLRFMMESSDLGLFTYVNSVILVFGSFGYFTLSLLLPILAMTIVVKLSRVLILKSNGMKKDFV